MEEDNDKNQDRVSILICSRDRRKALEALCSNLLKMDTKFSFETIVVEETDNPVPIDGTTYVPHPIANRGIPYARNLSLANAKGEIIVFLDDDCKIHDGWLDNLLEPFEDETVVGVQGGVTVPDGTNTIGWAEAILGFPGGNIRRILEAKEEIQETIEISTLNCAYRRWTLDKVGGFEKRLQLAGEDYVLAKKACSFGRCLFVPNAMVSHEARGSLTKIWSWFVRRGRAEIEVIRVGASKKTDAFLWLLKSSLVLKLLLLAAICILWPDSASILFFIGLIAYSAVQYLRYFSIWKQANLPISCLLIIPIVKFTMDMAIDCGRLSFLFRALGSRGQKSPEKASSYSRWK